MALVFQGFLSWTRRARALGLDFTEMPNDRDGLTLADCHGMDLTKPLPERKLLNSYFYQFKPL
jgi:hypothetical protein